MRYISLLGVLALLAMVTGCTTVSGEAQRVQEARMMREISELRMSVSRMEQRVNGLETSQNMLLNDLQRVEENVARSQNQTADRIADLAVRFDDQSRQQASLRQELADELSSRVAKLMQSRPAPPPTRTQSGYEHQVQPGETLSEIARAYGVSAQVIIRANNISDPNTLRVGQTLFIPE